MWTCRAMRTIGWITTTPYQTIRKNSYYGKFFKREDHTLVQAPLSQCLVLPTPDGKKIASKNVLAKNKLTIVQFWASNSYDVDRYQNELLLLYKKYHSKG